MSELPGNQIPEEALPDGGTSTPAADAEFPTVWCRHGATWSYVAEAGGWICDDPQHYLGDAAVQTGAIAAEHQPHYASDPRKNPAVWAALAEEDRAAAAQAIEDRARGLW